MMRSFGSPQDDNKHNTVTQEIEKNPCQLRVKRNRSFVLLRNDRMLITLEAMRHIYIIITLLFVVLACSTKETPTFLGSEAQFTESGLEYIMLANGTGPRAELGKEITTNCILRVGDSTIVWETTEDEPFVFVYSETGMIKGFMEAIALMKEGDRMKVIIPPDLGYGSQASDAIPANAYLSFDIDLRKVTDQKLWIVDSLMAAFLDGGKEKALALYYQMKQDSSKYDVNERHLRVLATLLKKDGRLNNSFEIVKLRVNEYPDSFGAHMQLAEVYVERGGKKLAIDELNQCLEINEGNAAALRMLEELE